MNENGDSHEEPVSKSGGIRRGGKRGRSGPPNNQHNYKHGYYTYKAMLNGKGLDERTSLFKAMHEKEQELATALGGDPSPQEQAIIADSIKNMVFVASLDNYLLGLKSIVRKGSAHPILAIRTQLSAHLRENLKTLGLKRVSKTLSWQEILSQDDPPAESPAKPNGHTEAPQ
jgi:hypothetical protein